MVLEVAVGAGIRLDPAWADLEPPHVLDNAVRTGARVKQHSVLQPVPF